jgi:transposase-like protein
MSRLENTNIITNKIKIETSAIRKICYFFSKDFTASQTATKLDISRQTINGYYKIFREALFDSYIYSQTHGIDLNITYMKIYEKNIYFLEEKNKSFLLDEESFIFLNINNFIKDKLEQTLENNKKTNSVRIIYNDHTKNFTILGYYNSSNDLEEFVNNRLKKFRGIKKENLNNHIQESFFRFNHSSDEINKKILTYFSIL